MNNSKEINEEKVKKMKLLYFISVEMNKTYSMKNLLEVILERCLELTSADTGSIMLINKEYNVLDILAFKGLDEKVVRKTRLRIGEGITGWVAQIGQPKLVNNTLNDPQYVKIREGLLSEIAVPIKTEDEIIGVISIDSNKENAFLESDLEFLTMIAELAAQIIKKDINREKLQLKINFQEILLQAFNLIEKENDLLGIFNNIMDILKEKMNILRGMLVFVEDNNPADLFIKYAYRISSEAVKNGKYKAGEGIIGNVVSGGQTIAVEDIADEPRFLNKLKIKRTGEKISFIAAPVKADNNIIGVLSVEKKYENREIFNEAVNTISLLASLIAYKVRNSQKVETETRKLLEENIELRKELKGQYNFKNMIGRNEKFRMIIEQVKMISNTMASVLITGETGTGKELVAKTIHFLSERRDKKFISVNCAAIPANLLETELFGHHKGAFTGAVMDRKGKFELADGGTLFLDEIGDMELQLQAKILRAIQEKEIEPLGSEKTIKVDIRIITATNKNLEDIIKQGKFRPDLFFRLNVINIQLPPLRERKDDIPFLSEHFVKKYSEIYNKKIIGISKETEALFQKYSWPGNIRELENIIERAVIMTQSNLIDVSLMPKHIIENKAKREDIFDIDRFIQDEIDKKINSADLLKNITGIFEKIIIEEILIKTGNNKLKAAKILGINRNTLKAMMKKYKITM
ncbi:MAG: sigma 54-interacting transcriptional regulator [Candidatus Goldbacteria bacterium]|nr:sigma 54-interacting transcriptional regulator [Candidatus Goldiibacteriota bacterium]